MLNIYYTKTKASPIEIFLIFNRNQITMAHVNIEIKAIDNDGTIGKDKLLEQCQFFLDLFKISREDLISVSYSDLLLQR